MIHSHEPVFQLPASKYLKRGSGCEHSFSHVALLNRGETVIFFNSFSNCFKVQYQFWQVCHNSRFLLPDICDSYFFLAWTNVCVLSWGREGAEVCRDILVAEHGLYMSKSLFSDHTCSPDKSLSSSSYRTCWKPSVTMSFQWSQASWAFFLLPWSLLFITLQNFFYTLGGTILLCSVRKCTMEMWHMCDYHSVLYVWT